MSECFKVNDKILNQLIGATRSNVEREIFIICRGLLTSQYSTIGVYIMRVENINPCPHCGCHLSVDVGNLYDPENIVFEFCHHCGFERVVDQRANLVKPPSLSADQENVSDGMRVGNDRQGRQARTP
jgi:hypothetical protein